MKEWKISPAVIIVPIIVFGDLALAMGKKKPTGPPLEGWELLAYGLDWECQQVLVQESREGE